LRKDLPLTALELGGQCYSEWKSEVVTVERFILKELGFCFYQNIEHPHKYLLYYIKVPLTHSLTHSFTPSLIHSLTHLPHHSLLHSLTLSLTHSYTYPITHSLTHTITHSHHHSLTHSLTHSLIKLPHYLPTH
jgi:hypothetical protein